MGDLQTSLVVNLAGNLTQRAQKYTRNMEQMSQRGQRSMRMLNRSANLAGKGLDKLGNRYTTLITGAGLTMAGRQVMGLETRFERLGIQANKSKEEMEALKKTIFDVAQQKDIRVDPSQVTSAIEAIVEKTGDLDFAKNNIRNIGMAIQATGADGGSIGEILAEFQKMGMVDPSNILETLDILNVQGKEGAFTLQNIAALGPRVITAYTATGRTGTQAMREMGAALQIIRMGTGESAAAATAFEATIRTLTDPAKLKILEGSGLQIFDPEAAKEGKRVLRPINEIMGEIITMTKGDRVKLGRVFDAEAITAFNAASSEFQRTGGMATLQKFMNVQADGTTTMRDSARAAATSEAALQNLSTAWQQFQNNQLAGPIQDAADALNSLEPETVQRWLEIGGYIVAAGLGLVAVRKGAGVLGRANDIRKSRSAGIGSTLNAMGAQRVFVVNMPIGGMGGGTVGSTTTGGVNGKNGRRVMGYTAPKLPSKWTKFSTHVTKAPYLATAIGLASAASIAASNASYEDKKTAMGGVAGGVGMAAAGGWIGAAALAWIPIVGPLLGYAVGSAAGYVVGETLGEELAKASLDGGINDGPAPRTRQNRTVSDKTILESLEGALKSSNSVNPNRRIAAQEARDRSAELKVVVEDQRTTVKSIRSSNIDVDIAGGSMVAP